MVRRTVPLAQTRPAALALSTALAVALAVSFAPAPANAALVSRGDGQAMNLFFMVQFWDATTFGALDTDSAAVADRSDLFIRRGRLGLNGKFRPEISFQFTFAYDNIGKDPLSAATGTPQAASNDEFLLWDSYVTMALDPRWANLTVGYFRPQVGRESITTAFKVNSFVKSPANTWLRQHLVGRGSGRETGINLGGLYQRDGFGLNYNLGLFDTNQRSIVGDGGEHWAPLLAWRLALSLGDPELSRYGMGYTTNFYRERTGVTLAVNGASQGRTNQTVEDEQYLGGFAHNSLIGYDVLANLAGFNLSLEYDRLERECDSFSFSDEELILDPGYRYSLWHLRGGYDFRLPNGQIVECVAMVAKVEADYDLAWYDFGVNWYLDQHRWKVNLHYLQQNKGGNRYFWPDSSQKGDLLGLGLQLVY